MALAFYKQVFPEMVIHSGETSDDNTLELARFDLGGLRIQIHNDPMQHAFDFTPSSSIFLDLDDSEHLEALAQVLAIDGKTMMPLDNYGFSQRFTWVQDRFGVSWQTKFTLITLVEPIACGDFTFAVRYTPLACLWPHPTSAQRIHRAAFWRGPGRVRW